jgi:tetratricopeptide (TPR) repeat protein
MNIQKNGETQPIDVLKGDTNPVAVKPGAVSKFPLARIPVWVWGISAILVLTFFVSVGAVAGYYSGNSYNQQNSANQSKQAVEEQFRLGVQNFEVGEYELALQRFEYVLAQNPDYPGITEKISQTMAIVYTTATPIPESIEITPTPTTDPRPVEEIFNHAISLISNLDWTGTIDTLLALRKADINFQVAKVDGMLYVSLRNRGVSKIINQGDLEAGIYDLGVAEKFGPLDSEASSAMEWARLYLVGLSFWEVHPEQAVYYFSQVAASAPYLSDGSGWTATERYRVALIQFGNLLSSHGDWCAAQEQFELALNIRPDETVQSLAEQAALKCSPPTPTSVSTGTITATSTPTWTLPVITQTPTNTQPVPPSATPTPTQGQPPTTEPPPTTELPPTTEIPATTEAPPPTGDNTSP